MIYPLKSLTDLPEIPLISSRTECKMRFHKISSDVLCDFGESYIHKWYKDFHEGKTLI